MGNNPPLLSKPIDGIKLDLSQKSLQHLNEEAKYYHQVSSINLSDNEITSLPKSLIQCATINELDFTRNSLSSLPYGLLQMAQLRSLSLSDNCLTDLPEKIANLKHLQHLDLEANQLKELPPSLKKLNYLNSLNLSRNRLTSIPVNTSVLSNLIELNLSGNSLTMLPECKSNLKILNISHNDFEKFPSRKTLTGLKALKELSFTSNQLKEVPESIAILTNLTILDLRTNNIERIDQCIGECINLKRLLLSRNKLKNLPKQFNKLTQLEVLELKDNQFTNFPRVVFTLFSLQNLDLSNNNISGMTIPSCYYSTSGHLSQITNFKKLPKLMQLKVLNISSNRIFAIDARFFLITPSLAELDINNNKISNFPCTLPTLKQLKILKLDRNNLSFLSGNFENFLSLKEISLNGNLFTEFPTQLTNLPNIDEIRLISNMISTIPNSIKKLSNLKELNLSDNKFNFFPKNVINLKKLQGLQLSHCNITEIPKEINSMKSLCGLDLSSNKINNIYISFKELNSLTMLNLSDNKIKMLPKRFFLLNTTNKFSTLSIDLSFNKLTTFQQAWSKLMNLRSLDLSFNQISAFPSEIFKRLISLETLKIAQNNAKNLNLISFVKLNPNLLFLHLEGNEINEKFLKRLLELKPIKRNKQSKRKTLVKVNMKKYGNNNNNQNNNRVTQLMQILPNGMIQWNCYKNGLQEILIGGAVNSNSKTNKHINKKINNSKSNNYNDNNGNSNTSSSSGSSSNKYIHKINKKNASQICRKINICSKQFKIGYSETIGKRFDMEDAIDINTEFSLKDSLSLFALYDGHSGRGSVNSVSHQFSKIFFEQLYSRSRSRIKSKSRNNSISKIIPTSNKSNRLSRSISDDRKATIFISQKQNINYQKIKIITSSSSNNSISSSLSCSSKISKNKNNKKINKQNSTNIEAEDDNDGHTQFNSHNSTSNKQKFKKNPSKLQKETSGSTAVVVLIGKTNIFCANAGDSRAVLFRGGKAIRLSFDHKPYLPEERKRIKQSGGFVSENFRVNSGIAVSRGFGDYKFRNQLTCNPYFSSLERNENEDQFIILACDGVWDVLTDDQAVGIVWKSKNVESAAIKIRNYATVQQSTDNISVIVIDLQPNVSLKERAKQLLKNNSFQSNSKTNLPHNPFDHVSSLANTTNLTKSNSINQSNLNRSNNSSDSNSNDKKHEQSQYNNTVHSDQNNEVGNGNDKEIQSTKSNKSNMKNFKKN